MTGTQKELTDFFKENIGKCILYSDNITNEGILKSRYRFITDDDLASLEHCSNQLNIFNLFRRKIDEVLYNFQSIISAKQEWELRLIRENKFTTALQEKIFIDINRRLTNFISSLVTLIGDFLEKRFFGKEYGKQSNEYDRFKKQTNEWYDTYFSYRFFSQLRHFSLHVDLPIQEIKIDQDYNYTRNAPMKYNISIMFNKEALLINKKMRKLNTDLQGYNTTFPLHPLLLEIEKVINSLLPTILFITGNRFIEPARTINSIALDKENFPKDKNLGFGKICHIDADFIGIKGNAINIQTVNSINEYLNKSKTK